MSSEPTAVSPEQAAIVSAIAKTYLWWEPVGAAEHGFARSVAQIMNIGTYDDILRLEAAVEAETLAAVMRCAQPGWFDARAWAFWRGRLGFRTGVELPADPPRRRFADAAGA